MRSKGPLRRNPSVLFAPGTDGYLAYDVEESCLHRLNASAALIVELCDGTREPEEVSSAVEPLLGAKGAEAAKEWLERALSQGLLLAESSPSSDGPSIPAAQATSLAATLRDQGQILAAFVCQHHATSLASEDSAAWSNLAELAHILGRREDARDAYERFLVLCPNDAEITHILASLRDEAPPPRAPDRCIRQLYARFAEFYEENMCGELDYRAPYLLSIAIREALGDRESLNVLDLGCGTGLIAEHIRPLANHLTGIDLSPEMVTRAQASKLYDVLEVMEITEWLRRDDTPRFDLILACDTLIYFGDLRQVIVPAASRIENGGLLAFTVEDGDHAEGFRLTDSGRYTHTRDHISEVAEEAGMQIERITRQVLRYEYGEPVTGLLAVLERVR